MLEMEKKISQSEEPKVNVVDWGGWRESGWGSFFGSGWESLAKTMVCSTKYVCTALFVSRSLSLISMAGTA